jgi:hypothetical protein
MIDGAPPHESAAGVARTRDLAVRDHDGTLASKDDGICDDTSNFRYSVNV